MGTFVLLIALAITSLIGQPPAKSTSPIDLAGTWRDKRGWIWTISQNGTQVTIVSADSTTTHVGQDGRVIKFTGELDGHSINYTDWTVLDDASDDQACQSYVGQTFEFPAKLKISKDSNRLERKAPESVSKGQCKLGLKRMPGFVLTRVSGK